MDMFKTLFAISVFFQVQAHGAITEVGTFDGGSGRTLQYVLGIPPLPNGRLFIFIEGDGHGCYEYDIENIKRLAAMISTDDYWVVPETAKAALCSSGAYKYLDFYHRVTEIKNLVNSLRNDPRLLKTNLFVIGHSGGVDLVSHMAPDISELSGIALISGSHSNLETMFYKKTLIDGHRNGLADELIQKKISEDKNLFSKIKTNCSIDAFDWGDRNNLFWCQILTSDIIGDLLKVSKKKKILLIHGQLDSIVPIEEAYESYATLLSEGYDIELKVFPSMDHSFFKKLSEIIQTISEWAKL